MRLTFLLPPLAATLLVACGPDDALEREVTPPPASEINAPLPRDNADASVPNPAAERLPNPAADLGQAGDINEAPADNGSGLGTASGAGTGMAGNGEGAKPGTDTPVGNPQN